MSNTNQKGDIGEAAFVLEAALKGYWTAKMPQDCPYDYMLDKKDGKLLRVQVKYRAINKAGTVIVKLVHHKKHSGANRRNYDSSNVDAVAIYVPDHKKTYLIPISQMPNMDEITFRCIPAKNNQTNNVRLIEVYSTW